MANEDKKDFNAMLHDSKDMPKFQTITDQKSIEKYGGSRMYFAPPIDYDKVMKLIPYGKVITVGKIREYFAELNGADFTEPITLSRSLRLLSAPLHFQTYKKPDISWIRFAFQHKNRKGHQRIGLRKDGQGNLLHPRSHPRCNQASPCVCASVQPPHQTGQRCGSIDCSFFTSFKRKGPAPHGVEPFSKLSNYFKILRGSVLFIQHELSINRLLFQAFHLLAL